MTTGTQQSDMFNRLDQNVSLVDSRSVNFRCPQCRHAGAFTTLANHDIGWDQKIDNTLYSYSGGARKCPNEQCKGLVFVILRGGKLERSFPPEVIDFDATNLPDPILRTLEELVKAHSVGCFRASALMVRRVLEEVCRDKQATGNDLKARIAALRGNIVIPQELLTRLMNCASWAMTLHTLKLERTTVSARTKRRSLSNSQKRY